MRRKEILKQLTGSNCKRYTESHIFMLKMKITFSDAQVHVHCTMPYPYPLHIYIIHVYTCTCIYNYIVLLHIVLILMYKTGLTSLMILMSIQLLVDDVISLKKVGARER